MLPTSAGARRTAWLALATGVLAGALFIAPTAWGPPGSAAYAPYETKNRVIGLLLLPFAALLA